MDYRLRPSRLKLFDERAFGSGTFVTARIHRDGTLAWAYGNVSRSLTPGRPRIGDTGPVPRKPDPIVEQLRFTRGEWLRALAGVKPKDALVHHGQMNSIGWIVGHLAWQEQRYLLLRPQGIMLRADIQQGFTTGGPMSTPPLNDTLAAWKQITHASASFVDKLTARTLLRDLPLVGGKRSGQTQGDAIRRMTYHYWFHIGEIMAIRQMLGQKRLPQYVGALEQKAPYRG